MKTVSEINKKLVRLDGYIIKNGDCCHVDTINGKHYLFLSEQIFLSEACEKCLKNLYKQVFKDAI